MEKLRQKKSLFYFRGSDRGGARGVPDRHLGVWGQSPEAPATVTVSVTDDLGHLVPGATVTIQGAGQDRANYRQGLTDGVGVFKAEGLAVGNYVVTANLGNLSQSKTVNVAGDAERFVQICLVTSGVTVSGRVTNGQSAGVGDVRVVLAGNYPPLERQARSDGGGGFAVGQVPDGRFLVAAEDEQGHYLSAGQPMVVSGGQVLGSPIALLLAQPQEAGTRDDQWPGDLDGTEHRRVSLRGNGDRRFRRHPGTDVPGTWAGGVRVGQRAAWRLSPDRTVGQGQRRTVQSGGVKVET
jgi:hypothetical protein